MPSLRTFQRTSQSVLSRYPAAQTVSIALSRGGYERALHQTGAAKPAAASSVLPDAITSPANPYIKHCVRLRENASYRAEQRRVLLLGSGMLRELAEAMPGSVRAHVLFVRDGAAAEATAAAAATAGLAAERCIRVSEPVMRKLSGLESADAIDAAAELPIPDPIKFAATATSAHPAGGEPPLLRRVLVLEAVRDPGNLGTLLRCALAFGWDAAWLLPGCCDPFNDKALRASRGAALRLPLAAGGWDEVRCVAAAQGWLMLAAEPEEVQAQLPGSCSGGVGLAGYGSEQQRPVALVLGTEGRGLSAMALALCQRVSIPMAGGAMESLNVGIAGGILMFALSDGLPPLLQRLASLVGCDAAALSSKGQGQ